MAHWRVLTHSLYESSCDWKRSGTKSRPRHSAAAQRAQELSSAPAGRLDDFLQLIRFPVARQAVVGPASYSVSYIVRESGQLARQ